MNVEQIVRQYMKDNGYTGLYRAGNGHDEACACVESELMCCGADCTDCEVGYTSDCSLCNPETRNSCEYLWEVHPDDRANEKAVVSEKCAGIHYA
jgi:hypothetical protein